MKTTPAFVVSPARVPVNATLHIQSTDCRFKADSYAIHDRRDQLVRKGRIAAPGNEFYLSSGGLACGEYWLEMGGSREKFIVY